MVNHLTLVIFIPLCAGFLQLLLSTKKIRDLFFLIALTFVFICSVLLCVKHPSPIYLNLLGDFTFSIGVVGLAKIILLFVNLFGLLIGFYYVGYSAEDKHNFHFVFFLWLIGFANLVILALDFLTFLFAWGVILILLYALLGLDSLATAKKAFFILGMADFLLLLGICLYITQTHNTLMPLQKGMVLVGIIPWLSFVLLLIGSLAKASCIPFHSWIPTASETAPAPIMAILPASLDKLLGIYLLSRICTDFFLLNKTAMAILMILGGLTIIFAVMAALVQHDLRKLLSFHAISQVGYMVLGVGTAMPIGVVGGIFHMINNVVYKTGLFLVGGHVGRRKNTFSLDELGGLVANMPLTFLTALVFALSISGIPPFNGFVSKWMIYQGLFEKLRFTDHGLRIAVIFCLITAMFGSALTLASFIKFIHAIFLGEKKNGNEDKKINGASFKMVMPLLLLSVMCIFLGIFSQPFLTYFIFPYIPGKLNYLGHWQSIVVAFLFGGAIIIGFVYGLILNEKTKGLRKDEIFVGAETSGKACTAFPASGFYKTLQECSVVNRIFYVLQSDRLDLFHLLQKLFHNVSFLLYYLLDRLVYILTSLIGYTFLVISGFFRKLHTGNLDLYVTWSLVGLLTLFFLLVN
ncbi:MAG: hypothetical protein NC818_00455 [Candidatus Omnitrophica bacterium]|nr:hypothetical protein [Candidatus Omnitrophota bacterium]